MATSTVKVSALVVEVEAENVSVFQSLLSEAMQTARNAVERYHDLDITIKSNKKNDTKGSARVTVRLQRAAPKKV